MEAFSALLALCVGNLPVTGDFPAQRPVMWSFDVFFDLHLNKQLSKQSKRWWFETPSRLLWRHSNEAFNLLFININLQCDVSYKKRMREWCKIHLDYVRIHTPTRHVLVYHKQTAIS